MNLIPIPGEKGSSVYRYTLSASWGSFASSIAPIRFMPCSLHVIIMCHCTIAIILLLHALSCQSHDMLHGVHREIFEAHRMYIAFVPPLSSSRAGSGNETRRGVVISPYT